MLRRQAAISGKQDQLEQKRDRERVKKPVEVLKAKEVAPPTSNIPSPPPPPPPGRPHEDDHDRHPSELPAVEMSDEESIGGRQDSDGDQNSNDGDVR